MPQQPRAHVTRNAILHAAAEEFERVGYEATPLSAILRRSGVTKGAFYFHFPSKKALALVRGQHRHWPRLRADWMRRGLDPLRTVVGMVDEASRSLASDVELRAGVRLACQSGSLSTGGWTPYPGWERTLVELLRQSAQRGLLRGGVEPTRTARVVHMALVGVRVVSTEVNGATDLVARTEDVWRALLPAIASEEWLRRNSPPALGVSPTSGARRN